MAGAHWEVGPGVCVEGRRACTKGGWGGGGGGAVKGLCPGDAPEAQPRGTRTAPVHRGHGVFGGVAADGRGPAPKAVCRGRHRPPPPFVGRSLPHGPRINALCHSADGLQGSPPPPLLLHSGMSQRPLVHIPMSWHHRLWGLSRVGSWTVAVRFMPCAGVPLGAGVRGPLRVNPPPHMYGMSPSLHPPTPHLKHSGPFFAALHSGRGSLSRGCEEIMAPSQLPACPLGSSWLTLPNRNVPLVL